MLMPAYAMPAPAPANAQFQHWRDEIIRTLYVPQHLPLAPRSYGAFSPLPGVIAERVTYGTEFGMRVPAIVYRPAAGHGRLPAMVVVNGHGGDKYSWYAFYTGMLYARAGAVVLTYDTIGEGERNPDRKSGTRLHDRPVNVPHYAQRLSGLMIGDVMQAVSYLRQRPDVDPSRVAVLGYSLGSFVAVLAGAADPRIDVLVLSGGGDLDGPGGYWEERTNKPMCEGIPWKSLSAYGDEAAIVYALNQRRGPTLIMNGDSDTVVDIPHDHEQPFFDDLARRVEALTGTKRNIFQTYWVIGASHRPSWLTRPAALWLENKLRFPNWTAQKIEAMPLTHISSWAEKYHVAMDKGYSSEQREGGVMALGDDIPGIPRDELNALPRSEWEAQKDAFVYGAWVHHALAAEGITGAAAEKAIAAGQKAR
jgi:dienelactone hydrolase